MRSVITSPQNPKIQWVRKLQAQKRLRQQENMFVVEGVRLVEEALQAGWSARLVLYSEDLSERGKEIVDRYAALGAAVEETTPQVLSSASDTRTPQGILAVLERRELKLPETLHFILICDALRDPGNLGTLLRTAAAVGVQAVLLSPGTVDPFSPKVVRAAMGAHFRLPILSLNWDELRSMLSSGIRLYVADAAGGQIYTQADFKAPLALIVGGEADGAGVQASTLADHRVHIPMSGTVESLNAAVAAAVLLFEVQRQRTVDG